MDYFRKYIGGQPGDSQPTGADTVERLCERVRSSTLLDDRRDAVRGLKALSKKFCVEVGTQGLDVLSNVLHTDRSDTEIMGYTLETLYNIMSNELPDDENEMPNHLPEDLGGQFTEMFIKNTENISVLLSLLEEYDFHVRWPTVKLLTVQLSNRSRDLQEFILVSPMGVSRLMDLLSDSREIIRNDESILVSPMGVSRLMDLLSDSREIIRNDALLLLIQLTKGNASIQKIVAFENGFEGLLDIIRDEGNSDGGIVVEDCLLLLLNLLTNNSSNQTFFKEGSYIQRLTPFFELDTGADSNPDSQVGWSAQKVTNIHLMLQLIRTLVSPNNPQQQTTASQKVMFTCGLLQQLCSILMTSGVPADVLTETINTVSEVIRGNQINQEYFASVMAPSSPPRPAIVVLLMSMVNEKQPFVLRCAVLYCFQSFLHKNEIGQLQIVQTLLPTTADVNTITAGQLLCGGLFSTDSLSNWFAAVALLHAILGNPKQKEQLLRVQLATSVGNPPVSLLQQCCNMLAQGGKVQTKIGLLMIISVWLSNSAIAVTHFLNNSANVPYLITQISSANADDSDELVQGMCAFVLGMCIQYSDDQSDTFSKLITQISSANADDSDELVQGMCAFVLGMCIQYSDDQSDTFSKESLQRIIENRIGLETFHDKLQQVSKSEFYTKAAKKAHLNFKQPSEVIFDHSFTKLFKAQEYEMLKAIQPLSPEDEERMKKTATSLKDHESIVDSYKHLIMEQDVELQKLRADLSDLSLYKQKSETETEELQSQVQQLKDQNSVLKVQKGLSPPPNTDATTHTDASDVSILNTQLLTQQSQLDTLQAQLAEKELIIDRLSCISPEEDKENRPDQRGVLEATVSRLESELADFQGACLQRDGEIERLQEQLQHSQNNVSALLAIMKTSLEAELQTATQPDTSAIQSRLESVIHERDELEGRVAQLEGWVRQLTVDGEGARSRIQDLQESETHLQNEKCRLESVISRLEEEKRAIKDEAEGVKAEQDDLLVLLADQDAKLSTYKSKLKEAGVTIDEEDELDDLDDDDDDDS